MTLKQIFLVWLCITCMGGCAKAPRKPGWTTGGKTVAVMPLDNQTNSVAGALYMREQMVALLQSKGYAPLSIGKTDQLLSNRLGISLGGQITEEDIPEIATALDVDAIMTGRLKTFGAVLLSYNEISASFALYTAGAWKPAWVYDGAASTPFSPLRDNDFRTEMIGGLFTSILERSMGAPLQNTVSKYYQQLQHTLPSGWNNDH